MPTSRRQFIKGATATGALAAFGIGYSYTAHQMLKGVLNKDKPFDPISGHAAKPEFIVNAENGELTPNPEQKVSYTVCMGCTTLCGVRVRVDSQSNKVLRVTGNPYHLLSSDPFLPYETSVKDSFLALSRYQEKGLAARSTACGRGNAVLEKLNSPQRVNVPLKRVGPRGSGQWAPISFEQLIEEVVEGGDLFSEGHVEGLRAIRDVKNPIDPEQPELGKKANQLAVMPPFKDGRLRFAARFAKQSFGTVNFTGHRSYCGLSMRSGYAALLGDWKKQPHLKPDFSNSEFLLFIGTAPANAGNPFKRQGHLIAKARSEGKLKYVVVDPVLTNSNNMASEERNNWIPIKPSTDGALVMAMIRWILENDRYDSRFLKQPNPTAAKAAGEVSLSNATYLVNAQAGHKNEGRFIRADELGIGNKETMVVMDETTAQLMPHTQAGPASLFYHDKVTTKDGEKIAVKTSLAMLLQEAQKYTLQEYSQTCKVPVETIVNLAREFTSHGKKAAADCHGGTMASNGFYSAYAIVMLNALVGNLNWKGGTSAGGGRYKEIAPGPRYNLKKFKGMVKAKGVGLGRQRFPYEKSSEYKRKVAAGENPYPSDKPWYPLSPAMANEFLSAALDGYPYSLKALILWSSNPIYGIAGLHEQIKDKIVDTKNIPLIVSIDPFINESNTYADYIVPDSVLYESWGWTSAWGGHLTKVSSARWPVIEPGQAKNANGETICMESFFIEVAKRMGLAGFGDNAIQDKQGNSYPLNNPEDYYLRAAANVAYDGKPVADASDEDIKLSGVERIVPAMQQVLKKEEWRKVAYVYSRGGRFENGDNAYQGEWLKHRYAKTMHIYDEKLATSRNSLTGISYIGTPTWVEPALADGSSLEKAFPEKDWPFKLVSTKSQLQSSHTIGTVSLQQIQGQSNVGMNLEDAIKLGIKSGDRIRITTPGGSKEAIVVARNGIQQGVIAVEHGFGHHELGARSHMIGDKIMQGREANRHGLNINDLGFADPKRKGINVLSDWVVGNTARQGLPSKIERV